MSSNIDFVFADIGAHNNWRIIEKITVSTFTLTRIKFTFCEMYFYKGESQINEDWVGILHDPEDTEKYYPEKNRLKHHVFRNSLSKCKGLFCMSDNLKEWVIRTKPKFFVNTLYHPLSNKNLMSFQYSLYEKNRRRQIGNWLRKTYFIYKAMCDVSKEIFV